MNIYKNYKILSIFINKIQHQSQICILQISFSSISIFYSNDVACLKIIN